MRLAGLARSLLIDDKSIRKEGEFERWLENALEKAPEYGPLDLIELVDPDLLNEEEYAPIPYVVPVVEKRIRYGPEWLVEECTRLKSAFSTEELSEHIIKILSGPTEQRESDLLDLVGFECIELVSQLIANRDILVEACRDYSFGKPATLAPVMSAALPGQSVSLNTESSKQASRQYRKLVSKGIIPDEELYIPETDGLDNLRAALGSSSGPQIHLPNVFVSRRPERLLGAKMALPQGTSHNDFADYEEFIIPYPSDAHGQTWNINPIIVSDLDTVLQQGFQGYKTLNRMQSAVFPVAHGSNENMLVCAPTGAGKTDVAMLAILKIVRDHIVSMSPLTVAKNDFKVVYVAPMKALAAEITEKFGKRLRPYGLKVREYTGDMQLTRREVQETQMIVTTPEKWDVITRKSQGDVDLVQKVKLLIIDEVHLLQDDRGPVIETLVARTLREVEMSQRLIRIVGLSATLPNYVDVAMFLRADLYSGLFVFGDAFRPVPLTQQFVGIKGRNFSTITENMNRTCFKKCRKFVEEGHQVMIFVHSRMDTVKTAKTMLRLASEENQSGIFATDQATPQYSAASKSISKSRNRELQDLFAAGFAFHHAGMLRSDRTLVEQLFSEGHIKVLVCTATLAWGVNLPAHAVIIKGTQVYDQQKGDFVSLGVLDVLQIFGRAGRPQYETHGEGIILTPHGEMAKYISAIMSQIPIESRFQAHLADNLNAEVALGTVGSIAEAVAWLKYSYLYVRMQRNPTSYGITPKEITTDPDLEARLYKLCRETTMQLRACGMVAFDPADTAEIIRIRDVGRIASAFYLGRDTVEIFGKSLRPGLTEEEILAIASTATEFHHLRVREEELRELDLLRDGAPMRLKHDVATPEGKASLLIMAHISKYHLDSFSLISDSNYVAQNGGRVFRALFEILRTQGWLHAALRCLTMCISFERKIWPMQHPLTQFDRLSIEVVRSLEKARKGAVNVDALKSMSKSEIAAIVGGTSAGELTKTLARCFPNLEVKVSLAPVTREVLRVDLDITPTFDFDERCHGTADMWWIFVENPLSPSFIHAEEFTITKTQSRLERRVSFYIPVREPIPSQLYVRVVSDRWLHADTVVPVTLQRLLLPDERTSHPTNLLPLRPLPVTALQDPRLETLYGAQFMFFNSVQTQVFHTLYHGTMNVMVGAPTGSGKTIIAELAIWNALRTSPQSKIVYVAPLKALIKERLEDWTRRFSPLGIKVIELSGDVSPDLYSLQNCRIIVTTPEKWDSVTRGQGKLASQVSLMVLDEIHLLGGDRGHVLEMIVTRMCRQTAPSRLVGLSTALANATDMSNWLQIPDAAMFNFRPSVRPVPLEVRIEGYAGRHYCPRMATMNKPTYSAILSHSPDKPVLVFVSSRRQTRLTANALVAHCVNDGFPRRFVQCPEEELAWMIADVTDASLRHALSFGIALHHAGLTETDRRVSETLFAAGKVQVMVATSTLAWGLNFPAHLVVVKGTEFYDARSHSYVNVPLTDVMQMIGRAGRPQFDQQAKAVILVQDIKKDFYKKFLYDAFPLESCLHLRGVLADHLNSEIVHGRVTDLAGALKMMQGTYLSVRALRNPNYYGIQEASPTFRDEFLVSLINQSFSSLEKSHCVVLEGERVQSTPLGRIASHYYLSHRTVSLFAETLGPRESFASLLRLVALAAEFDEAPIRHNEDNEIREFTATKSLRPIWETMGSTVGVDWTLPHTKVHVLLVAYLAGIELPVMDFVTDTRSILDQAARIAAALTEVARSHLHLETFVHAVWLQQAIFQGLLPTDNSACQLPGVCRRDKIAALPVLLHSKPDSSLSEEARNILQYRIPRIKMTATRNGDKCTVDMLDERIENDNRAYCREIRRSQDQSWRLVIADPSRNAILAHHRLSTVRRKVNLNVSAPPNVKTLQLLLLSENYLGLDQELSI
ncbi:hypothetical protein PSACC_00855 [Paramicrosporidium saccamoebae]|uniref:Sec63-domain-containing protein n=1 Tax=Paramicrosporidium saccamoebae TaxID=1246581 RepID=A0A2H9TNK6_9FUNG|nr:hypothetical protein PSACC_00855 [Paramicrosporidium saccamoebae]